MGETPLCWRCGAALEALPRPVPRREACAACGADLHVCRMCKFYDTQVSRQCREPVADDVGDKERANFCGYFQVAVNAYRPADTAAAEAARAALDDLFKK